MVEPVIVENGNDDDDDEKYEFNIIPNSKEYDNGESDNG